VDNFKKASGQLKKSNRKLMELQEDWAREDRG
jgi:hypothetical protein